MAESTRDDAALLHAVADGDRHALDELYASHAPWLVLRLTRPIESAHRWEQRPETSHLGGALTGLVGAFAGGAAGSGRACGWCSRDYDAHVEPNQFGREGGESSGLVAVESALDDNVLTLDVPRLPHPLKESLPGAPGGVPP